VLVGAAGHAERYDTSLHAAAVYAFSCSFMLFHALSCFFCFLMLWRGGLENRDDWNICLKTVSGGLRCFFRIDRSGLHQISPKVTCSRPNFTNQQKAEKATKSTKQHEIARKRRKLKSGGCNTLSSIQSDA
jgi:hypothetical protein